MDPITNKEELLARITDVHLQCYRLCKKIFGRYFINAGNIGIFCHSDEEYGFATKLREVMTISSNNPDQKYYELFVTITVLAHEDIPETTYRYLYIRKPDPTPYGKYLGDIDFFLESKEYEQLKAEVALKKYKGAQIYNRPGWDMIQLSLPTIHSVAYISTKEMTEAVHVKI